MSLTNFPLSCSCHLIAGEFERLSARAPWAIFPRKKLDVTYSDIAAGLAACLQLSESQRSELELQISHLWDPRGHILLTLSIRYDRLSRMR